MISENYNLLEEGHEKVVAKGICNEKGKESLIEFCWITNIEIKKRTLEEIIIAARGRWKIENEGFNNQRNGIYRIEHLNSRNVNGIKNTSSRLLESFRRQPVTDEDVLYISRYTTVYLE